MASVAAAVRSIWWSFELRYSEALQIVDFENLKLEADYKLNQLIEYIIEIYHCECLEQLVIDSINTRWRLPNGAGTVHELNAGLVSLDLRPNCMVQTLQFHYWCRKVLINIVWPTKSSSRSMRSRSQKVSLRFKDDNRFLIRQQIVSGADS